MPTRRFTVAAVASALAICCVVTLMNNDESIKSQVSYEQEHSGMMFDHDEDDEDSDELSEDEQALINAAEHHTSAAPAVAPQKLKKQTPGQASLEARAPQYMEDAQDALSPTEKSLIASAESGFDEGFKTRSQRTLIAAKKRAAKQPAKSGLKKGERRAVPVAPKAEVAPRNADGLSSKDASLIAAANHAEHAGQRHKEEASLKAAMAKITDAATTLAVSTVHQEAAPRAAVVAQVNAMVPVAPPQAQPQPRAQPVAQAQPAAALQAQPAKEKFVTTQAQATDDLDKFLAQPHPEAKASALPKLHLHRGMHAVGVKKPALHLPLDEARKLVMGFDTKARIQALRKADATDTPVTPLPGATPATKQPVAPVTPVTATTSTTAIAADYATVMGAAHATATTTHATPPAVAAAPPASEAVAPPAADDRFAAKLAAADAKAAQMARRDEQPLSPAEVRRAAEMRHRLAMEQHRIQSMA